MPNVPVRDIYLTQRIGNHKLMVYASEFTALPNDKVYLKWKNIDGTQHQQKMPTFCLTNILKVTAQMQHYIANSKRAYFEALLKDEELVSMTVKMAIKYAHSKPVRFLPCSYIQTADKARKRWLAWRSTFGPSHASLRSSGKCAGQTHWASNASQTRSTLETAKSLFHP